MVKSARRNAASIPNVLKHYERIEAEELLELEERHTLHRDLIDAIALHRTKTIRRVAGKVLQQPSKEKYSSQILMLKVIVKDEFPAPPSERVEWLLRFLDDSHPPFSIWAFRLLGDTRWRESIDALIDVMALEEKEDRFGSVCWHRASGELYRIFGSSAYPATAVAIQKEWDRLGQKVPEQTEDELVDQEGRHQHTSMGFFGDKISPRSVFVIDRSSSMRRPLKVEQIPAAPVTSVASTKDQGKSGKTSGKRAPGTDERRDETEDGISPEIKIDIVRKELLRALDRLEKSFRFNIVSFDAGTRICMRSAHGIPATPRTVNPASPARRSRQIQVHDLYPANAKNVASARDFTIRMTTGRGTNVYEAIRVALGFPGVDTIYLLSDGRPTRGGNVPEIEKHVQLRNYLKGVRVITYGFASEREGEFDEAFMQRLAGNNCGGYRRLSRL